ncbi:hypothetical protein [Nocardioides bruguierae]|uniref:Uncharacterized protein n=1 Tax=Nocardioides bruguierae TaxID=2945102 RepID=A0A9X2DBJ9_9ACTN|nr:hypothetical protein [Nocardioides bruguierae]MCM0622873.1 hypothetical protein [Nocardioides bruguierae]
MDAGMNRDRAERLARLVRATTRFDVEVIDHGGCFAVAVVRATATGRDTWTLYDEADWQAWQGRIELASAIEAVLWASASDLHASSIDSVSRTPETVRSLLGAGEESLAYETLCDNLHEDDIAVPRPLLVDLRDSAQNVGVDPGRVDALME